MATIFTHMAVAGVIKSVFPKFKADKKRILFYCLLASVLPDADVLAFSFGIPYEHPLGHRGFTHSILFALLFAPLISFTIFRKEKVREKLILSFSFIYLFSPMGFWMLLLMVD